MARQVQTKKVKHLGMELIDRTYEPYFMVFSGMVICQDDDDRRYLFDFREFFDVTKQYIDVHCAGSKNISFQQMYEGANTLTARLEQWCATDNLIYENWKTGRLKFTRHHKYDGDSSRYKVFGFLRAWVFNAAAEIEVDMVDSASGGGDMISVRYVRKQNSLQKWLKVTPEVIQATSFATSDVEEVAGNEDQFDITFRSGKIMSCHSHGWTLSR